MAALQGLSFLQGLALIEVEGKKPKVSAAKNLNPEPTSYRIRIHKDGSIYPSQQLTTSLSLEYRKAVVEVTTKQNAKGENIKSIKAIPQEGGMALDIIDSSKWSQYPEGNPHILLVGVTPRRTGTQATPKVEVFAAVNYNEDGTPKNSVMDQGSTTYGKETLLPLLKEVYGIEPNEEGFIDLDIAMDYKVQTKNNIYLLPKKVLSGTDAGKDDYEKRENICVYPLVPSEVVVTPEEAPQANEENDLVPGPVDESLV